MHLFVTGATGFLGSHFIAASMAAGHRVTAVSRRGSKPRVKITQEPHWCYGNLSENWSQHLKNCDVFVHLAAAGVVSHKDDWDYCHRINLSQSLNIWLQAINSGVKQFLICGSCFEYGITGLDYEYIPADAPLLPTDAYSSSKAAASMAALGIANEFNIKLLIVRPFHIYGDGEAPTRFWPSLKRAALAGEDFQMTEGHQVRDFMPVEDAASVILKLIYQLKYMPTNFAIHNIGTGRPSTLINFAQKQWSYFNAKGTLLPGHIPYRSNEIMRYVPLVASHILGLCV